MSVLYTFICEHGKSCNFITDCPQCAKAKITELTKQRDELLEINEKMREALSEIALHDDSTNYVCEKIAQKALELKPSWSE